MPKFSLLYMGLPYSPTSKNIIHDPKVYSQTSHLQKVVGVSKYM